MQLGKIPVINHGLTVVFGRLSRKTGARDGLRLCFRVHCATESNYCRYVKPRTHHPIALLKWTGSRANLKSLLLVLAGAASGFIVACPIRINKTIQAADVESLILIGKIVSHQVSGDMASIMEDSRQISATDELFSKSKQQLQVSNVNREMDQPYVKLADGNKMPMLGLGTWNAQGKELKDAIKSAIYAGYRHIDTASNYRNEDLVGQAINECIIEGVVSREQLFVTTKVWNNSHTRAAVAKALNKSLHALNLSYVDLYLIHYPIGYLEGDVLSPMDAGGQVITSDVDYLETWLGMEDVKRFGLTKSIGVSNFNSKQITRILYNCSMVPAVNQVECHPYLNQMKLLQFCRIHGIQMTAYSPLGSPGRLDPRLQEPYLIEDPVVKSIARKHQRHPAQILIRFQIQREVVVIPKAIQFAHIESNLDALSFELSQDDMSQLELLNRNHRFMKFERCLKHKYYPFATEF